jgi:hypothetical protein
MGPARCGHVEGLSTCPQPLDAPEGGVDLGVLERPQPCNPRRSDLLVRLSPVARWSSCRSVGVGRSWIVRSAGRLPQGRWDPPAKVTPAWSLRRRRSTATAARRRGPGRLVVGRRWRFIRGFGRLGRPRWGSPVGFSGEVLSGRGHGACQFVDEARNLGTNRSLREQDAQRGSHVGVGILRRFERIEDEDPLTSQAEGNLAAPTRGAWRSRARTATGRRRGPAA